MDQSSSFPRRQALTRRFTLGEPRDIKVSGDGARVAFLRSSGPIDPINSLWVLDVATGVERAVADPRHLIDPADGDSEYQPPAQRRRGESGPGVDPGRDDPQYVPPAQGAGGESGLSVRPGRDDPEKSPPAERARRERVRETASGIVSYDADEALTAAVFALDGRVWRVSLVEAAPPESLAAAPGAFDPRLSPDGALVAYVAGSTLRMIGHDGGDRLVAHDTSKTVSWGAAEFVAAEEMGRVRGHWWSPDSRHLLAARVDTASVPPIWIGDPASPGREPVEVRYPAAGDPNAAVSLAVLDAVAAAGDDGGGVGGGADGGVGDGALDDDADARSPSADTGGFGSVAVAWDHGKWEYLAGVSWTADGLLLTVQTRDQRTLGVLAADPGTGRCRMLRTVTDDAWVELVPGVPLLAGSKLVTVEDRGSGELPATVLPQPATIETSPASQQPTHSGSARTEDRGARRLCVDGEPLTPSDVQVRAVHHTGDEGVIITASVDPAEVHVARVGWDATIEWLTSGPSVNGVAAGGGTVVTVGRSLEHSRRRCRVVSQLRPGRHHDIASYAAEPGLALNVEIVELGPRRLVSAVLMPSGGPRADDVALPVLLDPYGGPHAQRVQRAEALFHASQWFADQGFCVLVVDGRGTPGRGPDFERTVRGDLAGPVLDDQIEALAAAADHFGNLDLSRVAIRGWSFGGYLAALAVLRRPDVFAAAIAGAPVTDWRLYDTHYTERYLGHPAAEPGNYERTDLIALAPGLQRPLMLIHGLADDNVVAAHTLRLSQALTEAGRPHTVLPLSGVTHMTPQEEVAENLLGLQLRFLQDSLGLPPLAPTERQAATRQGSNR